uniref:Uncharacterized protein n=1 Tax=Tanacetum cinerariifolium TaxID=118510 RepID=A0A6L2M7D5_TANCI|nr:hypothetical protein [Tanacetum cinerariifolium]
MIFTILIFQKISNNANKKALISEDEATYNQSSMPQNDDFVNDVHQQSSHITGDHMIAERTSFYNTPE